MVEFLHFDIQSTGQKSHCVNTIVWPSQCYVLIRQSDSPCPHQFLVRCSCADRDMGGERATISSTVASSTNHHPPPIPTSSTPSLRANPFPKVTDPFCRLPLPTLFYQLEAVHLGDLLRLSVRLAGKAKSFLGFSRTVRGAPDTPRVDVLFQQVSPFAS